MTLVCTGCGTTYELSEAARLLYDDRPITYCAATRGMEVQMTDWLAPLEEDGWPDDADMVTPQSEN